MSTKKNAKIMLLKILTHSMAGSVTFCCSNTCHQRSLGFKDLSVTYRIATVQ